MNALLLRTLEFKKSPSVQTFAQYREAESSNIRFSSVTSDGELLEHQTLELRVHPPNVEINNELYDDRTVVTVDSANRPGTLVEVVQCLTELGLNVKKARISSDGGWFVDEFHVIENSGRKVLDKRKLAAISSVLNIEYEASSEANTPTQNGAMHHPGIGDGHHGMGANGAALSAAVPRVPSSTKVGELDPAFEEARQHSTVFELAGQDRAGLLADVITLLTNNGCDVRSAAVWTYNSRVAFVVSVLEDARHPVRDGSKLVRLQQLLLTMMDAEGNGIALVSTVKGLIHYERRLHQLMLKEEEKEWLRMAPAVAEALAAAESSGDGDGGSSSTNSTGTQAFAVCSSSGRSSSGYSSGGGASPSPVQNGNGAAPAPPPTHPSTAPAAAAVAAALAAGIVSPKYSRPEVAIQHYGHLNYWLVTIRCKDRNKLFFDTVCTLSDLNYDVFHGAIDCENELATQLYYIRPRFGNFVWDVLKATKLRVMLEAAIQRRFPKGLKVHVHAMDSDHCLASLTQAWKEAGLWITRAKVRAYWENGHTLYVMDSNGQPPDPKKVQLACQASGGRLVANDSATGTSPPAVPRAVAANASGAGVKFFYAFLQRHWDGSPSSINSG